MSASVLAAHWGNGADSSIVLLVVASVIYLILFEEFLPILRKICLPFLMMLYYVVKLRAMVWRWLVVRGAWCCVCEWRISNAERMIRGMKVTTVIILILKLLTNY